MNGCSHKVEAHETLFGDPQTVQEIKARSADVAMYELHCRLPGDRNRG